MDFVNKFTGGDNQNQNQNQNQNTATNQQQPAEGQKQEGGFLSGLTNKVNAAAGGGPESEKNEDYLDKGVDYVQQTFMGAGDQSNESAAEQAKDEQISDFIRGQYKTTTGSDVPIKDKERFN